MWHNAAVVANVHSFDQKVQATIHIIEWYLVVDNNLQNSIDDNLGWMNFCDCCYQISTFYWWRYWFFETRKNAVCIGLAQRNEIR